LPIYVTTPKINSNGKKEYSQIFRNFFLNCKNIRTKVCIIQAIRAALEKVESIAKPKKNHRRAISSRFLFLKNNMKKIGQKATRKNPRFIGLSNKN
jgi:hypothetical protein